MKTLPSSAYAGAPPRSHATVVSSRLLRGDGARPGVQEEEAARAVRVLREARPVAGLAEERRLLVAGDARDRGTAAPPRAVAATTPEEGTIARQDLARDVEEGEELVVPRARVDVVEQRPRRVRGVGHVHGAARELPDEPRVDGAERELAARRPRARAGHVVEQPLQLRAGEVGVEDEARLRGERRLVAGRAQRVAGRRGAAVLPDDRVRERPARRALPEERRLALVRDADRRDVAAR